MKALAKTILRGCCMVLVFPAVLIFRAHARLVGTDEAFPGWSQLFSLLPGRTGVYLRRTFYSVSLQSCDQDACISFGTIFSHSGASVGRCSYIGNYCSVGDVAIGDDVLIASHVSIMNDCHQHGIERLDIPVREQPGKYDPITIGDDAWIGEKATVAASVGQHSIVGAGALVLSPVPDYAIVAGVPARIIGDRRKIADRTKAGVTTCGSNGGVCSDSGSHQSTG